MKQRHILLGFCHRKQCIFENELMEKYGQNRPHEWEYQVDPHIFELIAMAGVKETYDIDEESGCWVEAASTDPSSPYYSRAECSSHYE